jgi:uncharacterized protein YbaR (Trm112 family)
MHLLVTDRLSCPRCGPEFGLILLADRVDEHRDVQQGWLGCMNCREQYPIVGGEADLRAGAEPAPAAEAIDRGPDWALRLAALLGVQAGPAPVLLLDAPAGTAAAVSGLVPGLPVISADLHPPVAGAAGEAGRLLVGSALPLRSGSLRGVVVAHPRGLSLLDDAAGSWPIRLLPGSLWGLPAGAFPSSWTRTV